MLEVTAPSLAPHTLQGPQGGRQLLAAFLDTSRSYLWLKCP